MGTAAESSSDSLTLAGALLDGKYRVDKVVAEGGFGVVYAGHHMVLDVPIAIKVLKPTRGDASDQSERFSREAQTIARLKHPAIVQVLDAGLWRPSIDGSNDPIAWIVLEWLTGQTLKANLVARRHLTGRSPVEAMDLMRPVLDAVAFAHSKHVVHRDLKPSNIMLSPGDGRTVVRVLDFGVAKVIEEEPVPDTGHTQTAGSSHAFSRRYAAPEQLSGGRTGPWTDIHALGLMLTELLTDRPPYNSFDPTELYELVFHADRPSPVRHGIDVGPWQAIIERAVSLKPARRFADVTAFVAALEQTLDEASAAFASCQSKRVATPAAMGSLATDTTRSEGTVSNTVSVFSSESAHPRRPAVAMWSSRRTLSRAAALLGVAAVGSYLLFTGHRSAGGVKDVASTGEVSPTSEARPAPALGALATANVPEVPEKRANEGLVAPQATSAISSQQVAPKSRGGRRSAAVPVESSPTLPPAASAPRTQLPSYVVE